uniref:N-like protein n=1 Tax=Glypta fumiferanae TaxID=389681 RepID=A0A0F6Q757_9HYME|nr:N-like protein [Glypta fumiferanae]
MSDEDSRDYLDASPPDEAIDDEAELSSDNDDSYPRLNNDNDTSKVWTNDGDTLANDDKSVLPVAADKQEDSTLESITNDAELEAVIAAYKRKRKAAECKRSVDASIKGDNKVSKKNTLTNSREQGTMSKRKLSASRSSDIGASSLSPSSSSCVAKSTGRSRDSVKIKTKNNELLGTKIGLELNAMNIDRQPKKVNVEQQQSKSCDSEQTTKSKCRSMEITDDLSTTSTPSKKQRSSSTEVHKTTTCEMMIDEPECNENATTVTNVEVTNLWLQILATDFKCDEYKCLLMKNEFSAKQACALQRSLINVCNKIESTYKCNDRFMKTHKCVECEFSISHQCMPVEYLQYVPSAIDLTEIGAITPKDTFMCICKFGFYHAHSAGKCQELGNKLVAKNNVTRLLEHNRTVKVSCPRCRMSIVMRSRNSDVCSDFTQWQSLDGANRKTFFSSIENRLGNCKNNRPYMDELYTCQRQCCLVFHRCKTPQEQEDKGFANSPMP